MKKDKDLIKSIDPFKYDGFRMIPSYSDYGDVTSLQVLRRFIHHINKYFGELNDSMNDFIKLYTDLSDIMEEHDALLISWNEMVESNSQFKISVTEMLEKWINDPRLEELINDVLLDSKLDVLIFDDFIVKYNISKDETLNKLDEIKLSVSEVKESVDVNETSITNIETSVSLIEKDIDEIESSVNEAETSINEIKLSINDINYDIKYDIWNMFDNIKTFAHRGLSDTAQENTATAFRLAGMYGMDGLETDLRVDADGEWWCAHDDTLSSMTDVTGNISSSTTSYMKTLNVTKGSNPSIYPDKFCTFREALKIAASQNQLMQCEFKIIPTESQVKDFINILHEFNMFEKTVVVSFTFVTLNLIRSIDANIKMLYNTAEWYESVHNSVINFGNCGLSLSLTNSKQKIHEYVQIAKSSGYPIVVWNVNTYDDVMICTGAGVNGLTSNTFCGVNLRQSYRRYAFTVIDGSPVLQTNRSSDTCTISFPADNVSLGVRHNKKFDSPFGSGIVTIGYMGAGHGFEFYTQTEGSGVMLVKCYDTKNSKYRDFKTLPNGMWFVVIAYGEDLM